MAEFLNLGGENAGFIGFGAVSGVEAESMDGGWQAMVSFSYGSA